MKKFVLLALASAFLHIEIASAAVQLSFAKQKESTSTHATATDRSARRAANADLSYEAATYVVNVTVGTPGQPVSLQISSSASNTWVVDARSSWCTYSTYVYNEDEYTDSSAYCPWGTYSPGNSTSFKSLSSSEDDYSDEYGFTSDSNGVYAYGDFISDTLTIDGASVSNLTMGLANYSSSYTSNTYMGVLGIGYNDSTHDNLLDNLLDQGLINSTAYSIWLDDEAATSGNLLFGAVDTAKFEGNLTRLISDYSYYKMIIRVLEINGTTNESGGATPLAVTADTDDTSGYYYTEEVNNSDYLFTAVFSPADTVSVFPTDLASQVWQMAGARYDDDLQMAVISCTAAGDTTTNFTLRLGGTGPTTGPVLSAYMSDLVIPADEVNMSTLYSSYDYTEGSNTCLFGVQNGSVSSSSSEFALGSTLLRRTYSVLDLANNEIAVAPLDFDATSTSHVVPFASYGARVPSSTLLCESSSCYEGSGTSSVSDSGDGEDGGSSSSDAGVLSVGVLVGLTAGIALFVFLVALAGFLVWRHRLNRKAAAKDAASVSSAEAGGHPPAMSSANATGGDAPQLPEIAQTPAMTADKGKAPDRPAPSPPGSVGEGHSAAGGAGAGAQASHDADHAEASSSRNT